MGRKSSSLLVTAGVFAVCVFHSTVESAERGHISVMRSVSSGPLEDSVLVVATFQNTSGERLGIGLRWRMSATFKPNSESQARLDSLALEYEAAKKSGAEIHFNDGGPIWLDASGQWHRLPILPHSLVDFRDEQGHPRHLEPEGYVVGLGHSAILADTLAFHVGGSFFAEWPGEAQIKCYLETEDKGTLLTAVVGDTVIISVPLPLDHPTGR